jgi:hypothetical protein
MTGVASALFPINRIKRKLALGEAPGTILSEK